jgi:TonB family protein
MKHSQWYAAFPMSLVFHIILFSLLAGLTVTRDYAKDTVYFPVRTILLPAEKPAAPPKQKKKAIPKQSEPLKKEPALIPETVDEPMPALEEEPEERTEEIEEATVSDAVADDIPPEVQPSETVYQPYYKVSKLPSFKVKVDPVYPPPERASGNEARVVAEVFINEFGGVDKIEIIKSGGPLFDNAVIQAIQDSSFTPGYENNEPVPVKVQQPYVFRLR